MKRLWISLVALALIIAASFAGSRYFHSLTLEIDQLVKQAEEASIAGNWDVAISSIESANELWQNNTLFIYCTMRHTDTDAIHLSFQQAVGYGKIDDPSGFVEACQALQTKLWLMRETESLSIENIF